MSFTPIDDGGPAFPVGNNVESAADLQQSGWSGMTILDWFAGQALKGYLAGRNNDARDTHPDTTAYHCYTYGKSMIGVRNELMFAPEAQADDTGPDGMNPAQRIAREIEAWKELGSHPKALTVLMQAWPGYIADAKIGGA